MCDKCTCSGAYTCPIHRDDRFPDAIAALLDANRKDPIDQETRDYAQPWRKVRTAEEIYQSQLAEMKKNDLPYVARAHAPDCCCWDCQPNQWSSGINGVREFIG